MGLLAQIPITASADGRIKPVDWLRRLLQFLTESREPVLIYACVRAALVLIGIAANALLPTANGAVPVPWLRAWVRWDSGFFLSIADYGYVPYPQPGWVTSAFFPLYPLLIRVVQPIAGADWLAGLVVANICSIIAFLILFRLIAIKYDRGLARNTTLLMCLYPFSFFYGALYSEGLFLLLTVIAFYAAERDRWLIAGLAGGLASATRVVGICLVPAIGLRYLERRGFSLSRWPIRRLDRSLISLVLLPSGLLAYMTYEYIKLGNFLAWTTAEFGGWHKYNPFIDGFAQLDPLRHGVGDFDIMTFPNSLMALVALILVVPTWRRHGSMYGVYAALAIVGPLWAGVDSIGRYVSIVFPIFLTLAGYLGDGLALDLTLYIFALFLALFVALFANGFIII